MLEEVIASPSYQAEAACVCISDKHPCVAAAATAGSVFAVTLEVHPMEGKGLLTRVALNAHPPAHLSVLIAAVTTGLAPPSGGDGATLSLGPMSLTSAATPERDPGVPDYIFRRESSITLASSTQPSQEIQYKTQNSTFG